MHQIKTKQMLGNELCPGMRYWSAGTLFEIREVIEEDQRFIVRSFRVGGFDHKFFNDDFSSGLRKDLPWTVEA